MNTQLFVRLVREAGLPMGSKGGRPGIIPLWEAELQRFAALVAEQCFLTVVDQAQGKTQDDELAIRRAAEAIRAEFFAALPPRGPVA